MRRNIFVLFLIVVFFILGCSKTSENNKILFITSVFPLADLIQNVAGPDFTVKALLKPGTSPHSFEPTSEEMRFIEKSSVYFKTDLGLEIEKIIDRLVKPYSSVSVVSLKEGIDLISFNAHPEEKSMDPHIWVSPKNALKIIENVEKELSRLFPEKKDIFEKNRRIYQEKLKELDNQISRRVFSWSRKNIVEMHPAWGYFTRDYGLKITGIVQKHAGHEENTSLRDFQLLLGEAKKQKASAVFIEPQLKNDSARKIAEELNLPLITVDPEGIGAKSYMDFILLNVNEMEKILK